MPIYHLHATYKSDSIEEKAPPQQWKKKINCVRKELNEIK